MVLLQVTAPWMLRVNQNMEFAHQQTSPRTVSVEVTERPVLVVAMEVSPRNSSPFAQQLRLKQIVVAALGFAERV